MKPLCIILLIVLALPAGAQVAPQFPADISRSCEPSRNSVSGDPFLELFLRRDVHSEPRLQISVGSGIIRAADGIVVSDCHLLCNTADLRLFRVAHRQFLVEIALGGERAVVPDPGTLQHRVRLRPADLAHALRTSEISFATSLMRAGQLVVLRMRV